MSKPRILSGVQPTGNLHLGNYLGAIRNWVALQDSHECFFMLADLHAITVPQDPAALTHATREVAAAYIAAGIDTNKSFIFPQSAVSAHAELAWILNCHTPMGWLNRMTQFKEKANINEDYQLRKYKKEFDRYLLELIKIGESKVESAKLRHEALEVISSGHAKMTSLINKIDKKQRYDLLPEATSIMSEIVGTLTNHVQNNTPESDVQFAKLIKLVIESYQNMQDTLQSEEKKKTKSFDNAKLGLYAYPVLMAADILGYKATHVPVGADQKQHLELARDIAGAFSRAYGEDFFPLPEPMIMPTAARVMSLTDGTKKMSKSDPSDYSRITLMDDADAIATKIKKAQTDSEPSLSYDPENRPSVSNLIGIYAALEGSTPQQVVAQFANLKTGQFKAQLAELAVAKLSPITTHMRELMADTTTLDGILKRGAQAANDAAQPVLREVKQRVGFLNV